MKVQSVRYILKNVDIQEFSIKLECLQGHCLTLVHFNLVIMLWLLNLNLLNENSITRQYVTLSQMELIELGVISQSPRVVDKFVNKKTIND